MSARAARQPASKLGLQKGRTVSVRNAIYALVTKSAMTWQPPSPRRWQAVIETSPA